MKWEGTWRFNNAMTRHYGKTGTATVEALGEAHAADQIKTMVSRSLFGNAVMYTYVEISNLRQEK